MENSNAEETKSEVEEVPKKPKIIDKLKAKRWTFKVKNNLTEYVTVEPLICFYMIQIFVVSLIEPYHFHKACVSLDQDTYFCDVITINQNKEIYKFCASYGYQDVYCKDLKETGNITCENAIERYENSATKAFEKPEDYRFCKVIKKTLEKTYTGTDSLVGISVMILTFLVVMIVSIWSDKYSKRKICLLLPIFGQLITSISMKFLDPYDVQGFHMFVNLYGAFSTSLSFEVINTASILIVALSGGMPLFLFGCFSYMNNDAVKHKLLFRFGIIALILTIYRYIPFLYSTVYKYYHDDNSYINLISTSLVFNILCLLYVKIILNESKQGIIWNKLDNGTESKHLQSSGKGSISGKYSKRKQLAKAFSLDVIWDYILIIFKKRTQYGRLVILLFLAIVFVENTSPYDARFTLIIDENNSIDIIDIDGAIFVIISIMMLLLQISDATIAILVIGIPTFARIVMLIVGLTVFDNDTNSSATDFYTPFKRIASCSLLLGFIDKNETRIFLIVQAIAYLPKAFFQILTSRAKFKTDDANVITTLVALDIDSPELVFTTMLLVPVIVFCGLGLLYKYVKKHEQFKVSEILPNPVGDTIPNPWSFTKPVNYQIGNESDIDQPVMYPSVSRENESSTDL